MICSPIIRVTIDTPDLYENLKSGQYNATYYVLHIKATAHPNVLGKAKFFAENPGLIYTRAIFQDERGNYIAIEPMFNEVKARFLSPLGEDRFASLPSNYETYSIRLDTTTSIDLDFIEKWHSSLEIELDNNNQLPARFSSRKKAVFLCVYRVIVVLFSLLSPQLSEL